MAALYDCFDSVRRAGTVSISGVYGGQMDPVPMMQLFDKGVSLNMGQAHVKRWIDDILPLVTDDDDPLGTEDFATHKLPLTEAPAPTRRSRRSRTTPSRSSSSPTAPRPQAETQPKGGQAPFKFGYSGGASNGFSARARATPARFCAAARAVFADQSWPSSVSRYSSPGPGPLFQYVKACGGIV